jgi:hypothetical protein
LTWSFLRTPWGWCALQLLAAGLLYVFGYRRRFGRLFDPPPPARGSPLELVDARAGLLRAANAQGLAVELICRSVAQERSQARRRPAIGSARGRKPASAGAAGLPPRLEALAAKSARGERLTEREFIEAGRIAGQITEGRHS